ncbi:sensor histidine kinase [Candidatus Omnitrophota bacterium]
MKTEIDRFSLNKLDDLIKDSSKARMEFLRQRFLMQGMETRERQEKELFSEMITRIHRLKQELDISYNKLKELEKLKDSLMHMIVHDMNNPLMVVSGSIELLKMEFGDNLTEGQKEGFNRAILAADQVKRMVGDLLDINKMEEGNIQLNISNFLVSDIAKDVVDQMQVIAHSDNKKILLEVSENIAEVMADKELIKRVIANLTSNALKFTPQEGSVNVSIVYSKDDSNFYIKVKDTGSGIPKALLGRIFEKFFRVDADRVKPGRGLGLTFCKMAVEAHGGKIWAESEPGKGSLFVFTLPLENNRLN